MRWAFLVLFIPAVVWSQTDDTHAGFFLEPSFGVMLFGTQTTEDVGSGIERKYKAQTIYTPAVLRFGYKFEQHPLSLDLEFPFLASYSQELVYEVESTEDSPCTSGNGCLEGERKLAPFSLGGAVYFEKIPFAPKLTVRAGFLHNHIKLWQGRTASVQLEDATTRAQGKVLATDDKIYVPFFSLGLGWNIDAKVAKLGLGYSYTRLLPHRPEYLNNLDTEFKGSNNHRIEVNFVY